MTRGQADSARRLVVALRERAAPFNDDPSDAEATEEENLAESFEEAINARESLIIAWGQREEIHPLTDAGEAAMSSAVSAIDAYLAAEADYCARVWKIVGWKPNDWVEGV
jgi:hypothetical protein